ncbi:CRE-NHR-210 protein [Caenorhabditis remanei]|uniref:CRE-NHR-210 protein n=1 Tax=Caenorhabditis remanei TaxID=31234 RepID=E3LL98_CAERE|nr:CRE-NHR-210 protein [Caenorhabditis remanei]
MSEIPPTWNDLPFHFKKDLVSFLDVKSRFQLAASSKDDQELVMSCPFNLYALSILFPTSDPEASDYCLVFQDHQKSPKVILLLDRAEATSNVLLKTFYHQKSSVEEMTICYNYSTEHYSHTMQEFTAKITSKMGEIGKHQVKTRRLVILTDLSIPDSFIKLTGCFDSTILRKIRITGEVSNEILEAIIVTEQWKNLDDVTLQGRNTTPILQLLPPNVIQFSLNRYDLILSPNDVVRLVQRYINRNSRHGSYFQVLTTPETQFDEDATLQQLRSIAMGFDRTDEYTDVMFEMPSTDYVFVARVFGVGVQGAMQPCQVCGSVGPHGAHFGAVSCRACAAFFRRAAFSKWRNLNCRSKNCDRKIYIQNYSYFCKPCRLQKCFEAGMETSNSLHDSNNSLVPHIPYKSKVPQTMGTFVGRPEMILFWDSQKPTHKTYIDVNYLIDEATRIFGNPVERVYLASNRLQRLSLGLNVVRGNVKNYRFVTELTQKEVSDTWQFYFLAVAKWLTHFTEFEELEMSVKLTILQYIWHIWSVLDHHSLVSVHQRNNPNAPRTQTVTRRGVMVDKTKVHFDSTWLSDYPSRQIGGFLRNPSSYNVTGALVALQPTDVEMTFMLAQLSFEYAGKRCQGEVQKILERFQDLLADDIHQYYTKELRMHSYFGRLSKLMKVNNAIQKKIWEARPRMELAKIFNLIKLDFSHPEMFTDSGYN